MDDIALALRQAIAEEVEKQMREYRAQTTPPMPEDYHPLRLYSVAAAAKMLDVSRDYVYRRLRAGDLASVELGTGSTKQRIAAPELLRFIQERSWPRARQDR